jgi:hypothetical protein
MKSLCEDLHAARILLYIQCYYIRGMDGRHRVFEPPMGRVLL